MVEGRGRDVEESQRSLYSYSFLQLKDKLLLSCSQSPLAHFTVYLACLVLSGAVVDSPCPQRGHLKVALLNRNQMAQK